MQTFRSSYFFILCLLVSTVVHAQNPFLTTVRPSDPLTPTEEQKTFTLPDGFEIQLFASEPDINKPLNMAFDDRGRLWITNTLEYPHPVLDGSKPRDNIKILEDTNGDGHADKITTFADGLNIPMGIYPYKDGVIVFSIPYIWHLQDTNGDGTADVRTKLYGPMGFEKDTHGLNNAFRRGFDGWLYACHGFNNETAFAGRDGHEIKMQSGNTFRMQLNGQRAEHFTHGQVNPFGMIIDPLGNLFTADCHSKPIYQLLRGGYYPSFGKPDDGLGFVPPMMDHDHGSTAISGITFYDDDRFPPEFRDNIFTGNVMTSRINRDSLKYNGSTILAKEEPDFLTTTDPWFRPVDIQLGPDGALYVADFYNKIIGHYEVSLDHPERDRHRGRIWRIVYTGNKKPQPKRLPRDLSTLNTDQLIAALADPNTTYRMLALNRLVDRSDNSTARKVEQAFKTSQSDTLRSHALWVLHRLNSLSQALLNQAATDSPAVVRIHAMKVLSESADWSDQKRQLAVNGLKDKNAFVRRAAADALGQHPDAANIAPLLNMLPTIPESDNHLRQTVRMAIRNQLLEPQSFAKLSQIKRTEAVSRELVDIAAAVPNEQAASFLLKYVQQNSVARADMSRYLQHAARYLPAEESDTLVKFVLGSFSKDVDFQLELLNSILAGFERRGLKLSITVKTWGAEVAKELWYSVEDAGYEWGNTPVPGTPNADNPWGIRPVPSADGNNKHRFFYSKARGEKLTGRLRSRNFSIPKRISFYMAGHIGYPGKPVVKKNWIRLINAETKAVLAEAIPPRNDTAQKFEWDLKKFQGKLGYLEIVDGDSAGGYAWLAVGRLEPERLFRIPKLDPATVAQRQIAFASLAEKLQLKNHDAELSALVWSESSDIAVRVRAAATLLSFRPDIRLSALQPVVGHAATSPQFRHSLCRHIVIRQSAEIDKLLAEALRTVPRQLQIEMAEILASDKSGAEFLLKQITAGKASARLLQNPSVKQRLLVVLPKTAEKQIAALTADLPSVNAEIEKIIGQRKESFTKTRGDAAVGKTLFEKNCAVCHKVGNIGKLVGPQLDGIGNRGLERLLEDMLDPNRNVDVTFRSTTIVLDSGKVITGLFRREEGALIVLVDNKGKEFTVKKSAIDERVKSTVSLMPEGLPQNLKPEEFNNLLAYLLGLRGKVVDVKDTIKK